jgi:hypothetical protein
MSGDNAPKASLPSNADPEIEYEAVGPF